MEPIVPMLWFTEADAEEAVDFYLSVFDDARVVETVRLVAPNPSALPVGSVLTITFEIAGTRFVALNGGSHDVFNDAVSFVVHCATQDEIDRYWDALSAVPDDEQCGWCRDRFGVRWQVVPEHLTELIAGGDPAAAARATEALLAMRKIDIAALEAAVGATDGVDRS